MACLGASNYTYAEATLSQSQVDWLGSHQRTFEFLGGVPACIVPDNLKSGVTAPCYYEPGVNRSYQSLAEHYGMVVLPARPHKPRDKAKVEKAVQEVERQILAPLRHQTFTSLNQLNQAIRAELVKLNQRLMRDYQQSRQTRGGVLDLLLPLGETLLCLVSSLSSNIFETLPAGQSASRYWRTENKLVNQLPQKENTVRNVAVKTVSDLIFPGLVIT